METVIYFYKKRDLKEPVIEAITGNGSRAHGKEKTPQTQCYRLIRVGLRLEGENWFGQSVGQTVPKEEQGIFLSEPPEMPDKKGILGAFLRAGWKRRERRRREEEQRLLEELLLARETQLETVEKQMRLTAERIQKYADGDGFCGYLCETGLQSCQAWQVWMKYLPVKEFDGGTQAFWVKQLLPDAVHSRFVILGSSQDICGLIEGCADRMRSLRWILPVQEYTQELEDFTEDFYLEYGLAVTLQTVPGPAAYRKLELVCPEPVNVLDFTGEPRVSAAGVAEGSVWLDMRSLEEKRRRISARGAGIRYFSLRERWAEQN